jgi:hypothetical protein
MYFLQCCTRACLLLSQKLSVSLSHNDSTDIADPLSCPKRRSGDTRIHRERRNLSLNHRREKSCVPSFGPGVVYPCGLVERGQTVNSARCVEGLKKLTSRLARVRPEKEVKAEGGCLLGFAPCILVFYRRFRCACCLHHQGDEYSHN